VQFQGTGQVATRKLDVNGLSLPAALSIVTGISWDVRVNVGGSLKSYMTYSFG